MKVKENNNEKFLSAMFNLGRAIKNETERCGKLCGGLNEKELTVIVFVGQHNNVKMSDIAENIVAPMSTLTSIVDKLVEKGLLGREHSAEDRRVINVGLTDDGKKAYESILEQKRRIALRMLSGLGTNEQALVIKCINELAVAIAQPD